MIARAWYPPTTHGSVQRWTVHACVKCNNRKSHLEQVAFIRLAACVNPLTPAAAGMWEKAKRAMNPEATSDPAEKRKRRAVREAIMRDVYEVKDLPSAGVLPSFVANFYEGSRIAIRIPADSLDRLVCLWALGIHRHVWGEPATPDARVSPRHVTDENAAIAFRGTEQHWRRLDGGAGVQVLFLPGREVGHRATLYAFAIWGQFHVYAVIDEDNMPGAV